MDPVQIARLHAAFQKVAGPAKDHSDKLKAKEKAREYREALPPQGPRPEVMAAKQQAERNAPTQPSQARQAGPAKPSVHEAVTVQGPAMQLPAAPKTVAQPLAGVAKTESMPVMPRNTVMGAPVSSHPTVGTGTGAMTSVPSGHPAAQKTVFGAPLHAAEAGAAKAESGLLASAMRNKGKLGLIAGGATAVGAGGLALMHHMNQQKAQSQASAIPQSPAELPKVAAEAPKNNEDETDKGVMNVYPSPKDRSPDTVNSPWGEKGPKDLFHNSEGVWTESLEDRDDMLRRVFSGMENATDAEKSLITQNFETKDYHSHSALLRKVASHHLAPELTLAERVRGLLR